MLSWFGEARFESRQEMTRRIVDRQRGVQDGVRCGDAIRNHFSRMEQQMKEVDM